MVYFVVDVLFLFLGMFFGFVFLVVVVFCGVLFGSYFEL